jgi:hypothetical protein
MRGVTRLGAVAVTCGLAVALPAAAGPLRDQLDASLATLDTEQVLAVLTAHPDPVDGAEISGWVKEKVDTGAAPDRLAETMIMLSLKAKALDDALTYMSYYRALILIDSMACQDGASGAALLQGTSLVFGIIERDKAVTREQRIAAVDRAMTLEAATADVRRQDPSLCAAGSKAPGSPGTTPQPRYASDPTWRQHRADGLPKLRELLLSMNGAGNGAGTGAPR